MLKARQFLALEALLFMAVARLLLALVPVPRLMGWLSRPLAGRVTVAQADRHRAVVAVQGAILVIWRRGWLRDRCFHRAIAAHLMLRRRNIATRFHYGAATLPERGLTGHVWLTAGPQTVVGAEQAGHYRHLWEWGQNEAN